MTAKTKSLIIVISLIALGVGAFVFTNTSDDSSLVVSPRTVQEADSESTQTSTASAPQTITVAMVEEHNKKDDCWTIIEGNVYDITSYIPRHPGGDEILLACGADGTTLFTNRTDSDGQKVGSGTPHSSGAKNQLQNFFIGSLEPYFNQ